jgi:hypothetical protein
MASKDYSSIMKAKVRVAPTVTPEPAMSTVSRISKSGLRRKTPEEMAASMTKAVPEVKKKSGLRRKKPEEMAAAVEEKYDEAYYERKHSQFLARREAEAAAEAAKIAAPVDDKKLKEAREKLEMISLFYKGKTVKGKKIAKIIATLLLSDKYEDETGLYDEPFATPDSYGGEGREETIDDFFKAIKYLRLKVKIRSRTYAWYTYANARSVYPANALNNAIDYWNDSAEERGYDDLKRTTAEFNGNMLELDIGSDEDAEHDAAIWNKLA